MRTFRTALLLAVVAALGAAAIACKRDGAATPGAATKAALGWHCPMHPQIRSDAPGTCPICQMNLVRDEPAGGAGAGRERGAPGVAGLSPVEISAERRQQIGLKTALVTRGALATTIRTTGRVAFDEERIHHLHTKYDAFVEVVHINFVGAFVRRGEPLLSLYSPELFATQQEYLLALSAKKRLEGSGVADAEKGGADLLAAARQRLLLFDLTPADIEALEARGAPSRALVIHSPVSGYVIGKTATHGMKVSPMDSLFDIVDLTRVWVLADVFEYELPRVAVGQAAVMTLSYWPGRSWRGRVTYVFPTLDEKTRTGRVRLEFDNARGELKPEMFAEVVLSGTPRTVLKVPEDAVLDSGARKVVFLALGEGRLVPREVVTGERADGFYEVREGLAAGESVALGANFLVDSESRLRSALDVLGGAADPAPPARDAGGGSHAR